MAVSCIPIGMPSVLYRALTRQAAAVGLLSIALSLIIHALGGLSTPNLNRLVYHVASKVVLGDGLVVTAANFLSSLEEVVYCATW